MKNKRFTITQDFEEHHRQIRDNGHILMGCFIEQQAKVIVDLLNELNDKNKRLKQINKGQELEIVRLHHLADAMGGALRELGVYDCYDKQQIENRKKDTEELQG